MPVPALSLPSSSCKRRQRQRLPDHNLRQKGAGRSVGWRGSWGDGGGWAQGSGPRPAGQPQRARGHMAASVQPWWASKCLQLLLGGLGGARESISCSRARGPEQRCGFPPRGFVSHTLSLASLSLPTAILAGVQITCGSHRSRHPSSARVSGCTWRRVEHPEALRPLAAASAVALAVGALAEALGEAGG